MRIALDALPLVSSRMTGIGYCRSRAGTSDDDAASGRAVCPTVF